MPTVSGVHISNVRVGNVDTQGDGRLLLPGDRHPRAGRQRLQRRAEAAAGLPVSDVTITRLRFRHAAQRRAADLPVQRARAGPAQRDDRRPQLRPDAVENRLRKPDDPKTDAGRRPRGRPGKRRRRARARDPGRRFDDGARAGYGDAFCARFTPEVSCINLARGGRSTGSFRAEGRWDEVQALLRGAAVRATYVLIQFGHNDQPGKPGRSTDLVSPNSPSTWRATCRKCARWAACRCC
jgi:hypothetical protein